MPLAIAGSDTKDPELVRDVESERRLFYVALTRARNTLHLYHNREKGVSPFLRDIGAGAILEDLAKMHLLLNDEKTLIFQKDIMELCRLIHTHHMQRYLAHWADIYDEFLSDSAHQIEAVFRKAARARTVF